MNSFEGLLKKPSYFLPFIIFLSINVFRGGTTHDIVLSRAHDLGVDDSFIQEPWWNKIIGTKSHSAFPYHTPHSEPNKRLRTIKYISTKK